MPLSEEEKGLLRWAGERVHEWVKDAVDEFDDLGAGPREFLRRLFAFALEVDEIVQYDEDEIAKTERAMNSLKDKLGGR